MLRSPFKRRLTLAILQARGHVHSTSKEERTMRSRVLNLAVCNLLLAVAFISCESRTASATATTTLTVRSTLASTTKQRPTHTQMRKASATPRTGQADLVPIPDASGSFCRFDAQGQLTITIKNQGTRDAGSSTIEVQYMAGHTDSTGMQSASATALTTIPALAAGQRLDLTNISLMLVGQDASGNPVRLAGTLTITVNVNREVAESDYMNNTAQAQCPATPLPSQELPFPVSIPFLGPAEALWS
jgi:hypothetical protein